MMIKRNTFRVCILLFSISVSSVHAFDVERHLYKLMLAFAVLPATEAQFLSKETRVDSDDYEAIIDSTSDGFAAIRTLPHVAVHLSLFGKEAEQELKDVNEFALCIRLTGKEIIGIIESMSQDLHSIFPGGDESGGKCVFTHRESYQATFSSAIECHITEPVKLAGCRWNAETCPISYKPLGSYQISEIDEHSLHQHRNYEDTAYHFFKGDEQGVCYAVPFEVARQFVKIHNEEIKKNKADNLFYSIHYVLDGEVWEDIHRLNTQDYYEGILKDGCQTNDVRAVDQYRQAYKTNTRDSGTKTVVGLGFGSSEHPRQLEKVKEQPPSGQMIKVVEQKPSVFKTISSYFIELYVYVKAHYWP